VNHLNSGDGPFKGAKEMRLTLSKREESELFQMLESVPLFSGLGKGTIKMLASEFKERKYKPDEVIESEGDMGIAFYLITEGAVEVRKGNITLAKLGRGQFFGEMALLDRQPRSATVVASEPTKCLLLTSWSWNALVKTEPKFALELLKELARRLRETDRALSE
jgi:CRP-like cAMP-binding protein